LHTKLDHYVDTSVGELLVQRVSPSQ